MDTRQAALDMGMVMGIGVGVVMSSVFLCNATQAPARFFSYIFARNNLVSARSGCFSRYIGEWGRGEQFAGTKKLAGSIMRLGRELVPTFRGHQVAAVQRYKTWPPVIARGQYSAG